MSFGKQSDPTAGFKKFVSETEVEEEKKKRQDEWEKVRKPEDPVEAPEEVIDNRTLFDKLQQQKQVKEDEFADKHKFCNQIRGLDNDEAGFLELVGQKQEEILQKRNDEDSEVLAELHRSTVTTQEPSTTISSKSTPKPSQSSSKKSQAALLAGAVKRKSSDSTQSNADAKKSKSDSSPEKSTNKPTDGSTTAQVIGILPGLGAYGSSDSDEDSSDSDIDLPPNLYETRKLIMAHTQAEFY